MIFANPVYYAQRLTQRRSAWVNNFSIWVVILTTWKILHCSCLMFVKTCFEHAHSSNLVVKVSGKQSNWAESWMFFTFELYKLKFQKWRTLLWVWIPVLVRTYSTAIIRILKMVASPPKVFIGKNLWIWQLSHSSDIGSEMSNDSE